MSTKRGNPQAKGTCAYKHEQRNINEKVNLRKRGGVEGGGHGGGDTDAWTQLVDLNTWLWYMPKSPDYCCCSSSRQLRKNQHYKLNKLAINTKLFEELKHIKTWWVFYWP